MYTIRHGDRVIARRLFQRAGDSIRLRPDNPSFMDDDVHPGPRLMVLVRQVWRGARPRSRAA